MSRKLSITVLIGLMILLVSATYALAQERNGRRQGSRPDGPPVAYGEILAIDSESITIAPMIPPMMQERLEENEREMPELPTEITFSITDRTKFFAADGEGNAGDFSAGDMIVIRPLRGSREAPVAEIVADEATAKQFVRERLRQGGQGPGGQGEQQRPRVAFGEILSISADGISIRPMITEAARERIEESDRELPELPDEMSFAISDRTRFFTEDGKAEISEFSIGELVAIVPVRGKDGPLAGVIGTEEAARKFIQQQGRGRNGQANKGDRDNDMGRQNRRGSQKR